MNKIRDMRYYRVAFMTFFCLAIEQTSDSSWLSGKGRGYCMLLALCLNANRNMKKDKEDDEVLCYEDENENRELHYEDEATHIRKDYWLYHNKRKHTNDGQE